MNAGPWFGSAGIRWLFSALLLVALTACGSSDGADDRANGVSVAPPPGEPANGEVQEADVALALSDVSPGQDAQGVPVNTEVVLTFSAPLNAESLTEGLVSLSGPSGSVAVQLTVDGQRLVMTPQGPLDHSTSYTLVVESGISAEGFLPLGEAVEWSFVTGPEPQPAALYTYVNTNAVRLEWQPDEGHTYNVFYAAEPDCDFANYTGCNEGTLVTNVEPPYLVRGLTNRRNYWFRVESVASGGRVLSDEAGSVSSWPRVNGAVNAIEVDKEGRVYVGGDFRSVGFDTGSHSAFLNRADMQILPSPELNFQQGSEHSIDSATPDGEGGWFIGGSFDAIYSQARNAVARIRSNGQLAEWSTVDLDPESHVLAMTYADGILYVTGSICLVGQSQCDNLAALDSQGRLLWSKRVGGFYTSILAWRDRVFLTNCRRYFLSEYEPCDHDLLSLDSQGEFADWVPDIFSYVSVMKVFKDQLYVAGRARWGGQAPLYRHGLVRFDAPGGSPEWVLDFGLQYGGGCFLSCGIGLIKDFAVDENHIYVVGFNLNIHPNIDHSDFVVLDHQGNELSWPSWRPENISSTCEYPCGIDLITADETAVYAVYSEGRDNERHALLVLNHQDSSQSFKMVGSGFIYSMALSGNQLYLQGWSTSIYSEIRQGLVSFDSDGTMNDWNPGLGGEVTSLHLGEQGIYMGGHFTEELAGSWYGVALADDRGNLLDWEVSADAPVHSIASAHDRIYLGGEFNQVNSSGRRGIAAVDKHSGGVHAWSPGVEFDVHSILPQGDTIYASGVGGSNRLRAFDVSGSSLAWSPTVEGNVEALYAYDDLLYAGGDFSKVDNLTAQSLVAFDGAGDPLLVAEDFSRSQRVTAFSSYGRYLLVGGDVWNAPDRSWGSGWVRAYDTETDSVHLLGEIVGTVNAMGVSGTRLYVGGQDRDTFHVQELEPL